MRNKTISVQKTAEEVLMRWIVNVLAVVVMTYAAAYVTQRMEIVLLMVFVGMPLALWLGIKDEKM